MTESTVDDGCLRFIPGSHLTSDPGVHDSTPKDGGMFSGSLDPVTFDEATAIDVPLEPGQFVVFDVHTIHGSQQRRPASRRLLVSRHAQQKGFLAWSTCCAVKRQSRWVGQGGRLPIGLQEFDSSRARRCPTRRQNPKGFFETGGGADRLLALDVRNDVLVVRSASESMHCLAYRHCGGCTLRRNVEKRVFDDFG